MNKPTANLTLLVLLLAAVLATAGCPQPSPKNVEATPAAAPAQTKSAPNYPILRNARPYQEIHEPALSGAHEAALGDPDVEEVPDDDAGGGVAGQGTEEVLKGRDLPVALHQVDIGDEDQIAHGSGWTPCFRMSGDGSGWLAWSFS